MRLLFFDMEFADGRVPGSIYSFGYLMTDEKFEIVMPQSDLLINPDSTWNEYVEQNILAYPKETVEASPKFPEVYDKLKALFDEADIAVGFSVNNDTRALKKDCARYGLPPISFRCFDTEKLCRMMEEHKEAHGLGGYVEAWCGEKPDNRHRSDGDAYATMILLRAVCAAKHVTPEMMIEAYPECTSDTSAKEKNQTAPTKGKQASSAKAKRSRRRRRPRKKTEAEA